MKTIGIIGGLGPEATADYYKEIIKQFNTINQGGSLNYPEIVIFSVNMSKFIGLLEKGQQTEAAAYLVESVEKLARAGADFAAISANTPHLLYPEIQKNSPIPLISIVESCCEAAVKKGVKKCGLFGTRFTMQARFYHNEFAKSGIEVVSPDAKAMERINTLLFTELELGIFTEATKQELLALVQQMKTHQGIDALILGCTEFPIMFTSDTYLGLPFLNTTKFHVESIVKQCLT